MATIADLLARYTREAEEAKKYQASAPLALVLSRVIEDLLPLTEASAHVSERNIARQIDQLLTVREVAARLRVSVGWVYHHRDQLPFVRRDPLRPRTVCFSERGLEKYMFRMRS